MKYSEDFVQALHELGLTVLDFEGWCEAAKRDPQDKEAQQAYLAMED